MEFIARTTLDRDDLMALAGLFQIEVAGKSNRELAEAIIIAMAVERILYASE